MKTKRTFKRASLRRKVASRRRRVGAKRTQGGMQRTETVFPLSRVGQGDQISMPLRAEPPYRLIFETMNQGLLVLTEEGSIVYANPSFAKIVKVSHQEIAGLRFREFVAFAHQGKFAQLLQESRREAQVDEIVLWTRDRNVVPALLSLVPLVTRDAEICAVVTDLSAVIAARRDGMQLTSIVQSSGDAILSIGPGGMILTWNEAAQRTFGYKASEAVGRPVEMLVSRDHPEDREALVLGETLAIGPRRFETVMVCKDGRKIDVAVTVSLIKNFPGERAVIIRDISLRKQSEAQLRELTRKLLAAKEQERQRIARELHDSTVQNLAALAIELALVTNTLQTDDTNLKRLEHATTLAKQSTDEVRNLARLLHPPALEEVGLSAALRTYVQIFSERHSVRVDLETPLDLGGLPQAIEVALFRVVQEALTNVYRHSGSPTAKVRIIRDAKSVMMEVADRGRGMPSLDSLPAAGTRPRTGMGLSTMRERVELLGGKLEIRSTSQGTTVRANFPLPGIEQLKTIQASPAASNQ